MSTSSQRQLVNPRLGNYFSVLAALFLGIFVLIVVFEQLGSTQMMLRWAMLLAPLVLYAVLGICCYATSGRDFFVAGRRVPASYAGLNLSASAVGGTGLVAFTGLFFLHGSDAWCLSIGIAGGFVVMALMTAPYVRKFGAFTIPSYLGRRFNSRVVRLTAAALLAVPMLLILLAELRMALIIVEWLSGWSSAAVMAVIIAPVILFCLVPGGVRGLAWTTSGQMIVALLALLIPVCVVAAIVTNLPLPQFSYGPVLRGIGRLEAVQGIPIPVASALAFDFAGQGLEPITSRMAAPYTKVGPVSFILASLCIMTGIAAAPWLLPRCATTPSVYDARKSVAWAIFFSGVIIITTSAVAVFLRDFVMENVVGVEPDKLPLWFKWMQGLGIATVDSTTDRVSLTALKFQRDAILFSLPVAAGFPNAVLYLAAAGALAMSLAAANATIALLGNIISEDAINGLSWEAPAEKGRILAARIAIAVTALGACWVAVGISADPLSLLLWGLALSGSAAFPILVVSVWWKEATAFGAASGMITGFVVATIAITEGNSTWLGVPSVLAAVYGVPAGFVVTVLASRFGRSIDRATQDRIQDMRMPGGEAVYDRQLRLQRLKEQQDI